MVNKYYFKAKLLLLTVCMLGCQNFQPETQRLIKDSQDQLLCEFNFDEFNNRIYDFWLQEKNPPSAEEFGTKIYSELQKNKVWDNLTEEERDKINVSISRYYQFLTEKLIAKAVNVQERMQLLSSLELGDHSGEKNDLQKQWEAEKQKFTTEMTSLQLPLSLLCEDRRNKESAEPHSKPSVEPPVEIPSNEVSSTRAVEGLRRTLATAYQSCEVLKVKPVSAQSPNIEGIKILNEPHQSGRGRKRVYQNIQRIFKTNPYYTLNAPMQKGCYANTTQPLIYDFGGKPKTTTASDSTLDFFSNAGTGTNVLGVDCSAFIFSALARGGLKFAPNKNLKAVLVHGTSAAMFKSPSKNGMTCFESIVDLKTSTLEPGDIIASDGHVVMVDRIGSDPLGIQGVKNVADCSKVSSSSFDFTVSQSGNWKNGIGIHQSLAKDYLKSYSTFQKGLTQLAQHFCQEKFKPPKFSVSISELLSIKPDLGDMNVIRHKGTPECLTSNPIALKYESCVENCQWN